MTTSLDSTADDHFLPLELLRLKAEEWELWIGHRKAREGMHAYREAAVAKVATSLSTARGQSEGSDELAP